MEREQGGHFVQGLLWGTMLSVPIWGTLILIVKWLFFSG